MNRKSRQRQDDDISVVPIDEQRFAAVYIRNGDQLVPVAVPLALLETVTGENA